MKKLTVLAVMVVFIGVFALAGSAAAERFIKSADGKTVTDTQTNLMWAAQDNGSNISWGFAEVYCEGYTGGGYSGWRMPTINELGGLYAGGGLSLIKHSGSFVWSSTKSTEGDRKMLEYDSGEHVYTPLGTT